MKYQRNTRRTMDSLMLVEILQHIDKIYSTDDNGSVI